MTQEELDRKLMARVVRVGPEHSYSTGWQVQALRRDKEGALITTMVRPASLLEAALYKHVQELAGING